VRTWRRAESLAAAMASDYDVAFARLQFLRHDLAGDEHDRLLAEVIETFERLGAVRQLRIAEAL
jgi:hypothetical protein